MGRFPLAVRRRVARSCSDYGWAGSCVASANDQRPWSAAATQLGVSPTSGPAGDPLVYVVQLDVCSFGGRVVVLDAASGQPYFVAALKPVPLGRQLGAREAPHVTRDEIVRVYGRQPRMATGAPAISHPKRAAPRGWSRAARATRPPGLSTGRAGRPPRAGWASMPLRVQLAIHSCTWLRQISPSPAKRSRWSTRLLVTPTSSRGCSRRDSDAAS